MNIRCGVEVRWEMRRPRFKSLLNDNAHQLMLATTIIHFNLLCSQGRLQCWWHPVQERVRWRGVSVLTHSQHAHPQQGMPVA